MLYEVVYRPKIVVLDKAVLIEARDEEEVRRIIEMTNNDVISVAAKRSKTIRKRYKMTDEEWKETASAEEFEEGKKETEQAEEVDEEEHDIFDI